MKKVLLVQPNYRHQRVTGAWETNPPLGLCYIAAVLEQNKIPVKILEANALNLTVEDVVREAKDYDIVGVSFMTPAHTFAIKVAQALPPSILKVAGGPQPTGVPDEVLNGGFDMVVRGEGEKAMMEIVSGVPLEEILGLSWKKDGEIVHNPQRPVMTDEELNQLPYPARHLLPSNGVNIPYRSAATKWLPWSPIFATRGCPYNCYFCHKIFGYKIRFRDPESIVKEIVYLKETYGVREIDFYDDCFNADINFAHKVMDLIIAKNLKIHFRFSNGIRINMITPELLKKFKKAGVDWISYGIESGNQKVLDRIPKHLTLDQIRQVVKWTKDAGGITVCGFMMIGLLGDTRESMQQTIDFAKELDLDIAVFSMLTPYPGSAVWTEVQKNGKLLLNGWEDFHHTSSRMAFTHPEVASPEVVEEMYQKAHREFYMRPKYMIKRLFSVRNMGDVKFLFRGFKALLHVREQEAKTLE